MQTHRFPRSVAQSTNTNESKGELIVLPAMPSFSLADANTIVDIEIQADQLLNYINKLTSLADRACSTAIRQTETAHFIEENRQNEIADLRNKLAEQNAKSQEQQIAMIRLEEEAKAQIAALETELRRAGIQRNDEKELRILRSKNAGFFSRLDEAEEVAKHAKTRIHEQLAPLNQEVAELRVKLANRDKTIQTKNNMIKTIELEFRPKILELEQCLRDSEAKLHEQETLLKEKEALVQATGRKEAEIGKLIARLSAECGKLNTELQEKSRLMADPEPKKAQPVTDSKMWRQVIGRFQEESS
jgi:chromosome segregation ATPase